MLISLKDKPGRGLEWDLGISGGQPEVMTVSAKQLLAKPVQIAEFDLRYLHSSFLSLFCEEFKHCFPALICSYFDLVFILDSFFRWVQVHVFL